MVRNRKTAEPTQDQVISNDGQTVVLWKAKMPLSDEEFEMLAARARAQQETTGVRVMLVPYSVEAEVQTLEAVDGAEAGSRDTTPTADDNGGSQ